MQNHLILYPCHKLKTIESEHESLDSIMKHTRTLKSLIYLLMAFLVKLDPEPHTFQLKIIKKKQHKTMHRGISAYWTYLSQCLFLASMAFWIVTSIISPFVSKSMPNFVPIAFIAPISSQAAGKSDGG
jgi:hypothetical protein